MPVNTNEILAAITSATAIHTQSSSSGGDTNTLNTIMSLISKGSGGGGSGKTEKRDYKQEFLDSVANKSGLLAAATMEDAFKHQNKQIEQAMIEHGSTIQDVHDVVTKQIAPPHIWSTAGVNDKRQAYGDAAIPIILKLMSGQAGTIKSGADVEEQMAKAQYYKSGGSSYANATSPEDIQNTVQGVVNGDLPPDLKSIASYRDRTRVSSAFQKSGYDLTTANKDWLAANKFYSSMNSTQQVRLRQAIGSVGGALDNLDNLNEEYKRLGFTPANKMQLIANSKGVGKQAELSVEYLTSLGVIQDELSQVFMGGNSPTEKFLEQAQKILKSDYTFEQLQGVTKQLRLNLKYRLNSIDKAEPYSPTSKKAEEDVRLNNQNNSFATEEEAMASGIKGEVIIGGRRARID